MYALKELDVANNVLLSVPEEIGCLVRSHHPLPSHV
jgi:hypothetical protein